MTDPMTDPGRRNRHATRPRGRVALLLALLSFAAPLAAQSEGGMLFAYRPHPGERADFEAGYREHLDWHREKGDPLIWFGWDVIAGRRLGQFVDGTVGIPFVALDRRVDPAGDAAHAGRSFAPHAVPTARWAMRLRPELSTATPLERGSPTPLAQVVTYSVAPGERADFEGVLAAVRKDAAALGLLPYTIYEMVVGGPAKRARFGGRPGA